MSRARVLIVDDEPDMVENCARILKPAGYECLVTTDARRALEILESEHPDLLLTDLKMPEVDGMELLHRAHELDPALPVIMITAFATVESAVAAVKEGAFDYLPKNFSVDQLRGGRGSGPPPPGPAAREPQSQGAARPDLRERTSSAGVRP